MRQQVSQAIGHAPQGSICLLTQARSWGLSFNPVSFFYCHEADGQLAAIVCEVTNTPWRERYHYVLPATAPGNLSDFHQHFAVTKAFHVSPFLPPDLEYRMSFSPAAQKLGVHMADWQGEVKLFDATLNLQREATGSRQPAPLLAALSVDDGENLPGDLLAGPALAAQTRTDICSSGCRWQRSNRHGSAQGSPS